MARRKKKLSDEEVDELINDWLSSVNDMREFFFEHSPEEDGDEFYDHFLEHFQIVEKIFRIMVKEKLIVTESKADKDREEFVIKPKKGVRSDN